MKKILLLLIFPLALCAQQKQPGLMLTATDPTPGVTYTFYMGAASGQEGTSPIPCKAGVGNANQCFWVNGTSGTIYYFTSVAWLMQGGINYPSAPSTEVSFAFPTVPAVPTVSVSAGVF